MAPSSRLPSARRPGGDAARSRPVSMIEGSMSNLTNLSLQSKEEDPAKKPKRRSLLPQFPRMTSNHSKEDSNGGIKEEEEQDSAEMDRDGSQDTQSSGESIGRKAIDEDRRAMPPPSAPAQPQSRLSRPTSMIPPRNSSKMQAMRSHARGGSDEKTGDQDDERAQSLAALTGGPSTGGPPASSGGTPTPSSKPAAPESGLKRAGSTRLPQSPRPGIPSRTTSVRTKEGHTRAASTATSSIAEKRSSVASRRQTSTTTASIAQPSNTTSPPSPPQRAPATQRPRPSSMLPSHSSKPSFNTYQQHYSPAKSALPKPPIPSSRTSSKPAAGSAEEEPPSFETTKAQLELLQLSLLHEASAKTSREYTASAKRKLSRRHNKLRKEYEGIRATELVHQRAVNLAALESWCSDPGLLVENLQILSMVYSDLTGLMEPGSRYAEIVELFELWVEEAQGPAGEGGFFVQPLGEDWRNAHGSLVLKLRAVHRNFGVLPPVKGVQGEESSGLGVALDGCRGLAEDMLAELEVMVKVEREVLSRERAKVEEEVKGLVGDDGGVQESKWVPAWQRAA